MKFRVDGVPKAQPRPKVVSARGRTWAYTPASAKEWKMAVRMAAIRNGCPVYSGPVRVDVTFIMPRPDRLKKAHPGRQPHPVKPDRDNLDKVILDALEAAGRFRDQQVCAGEISKMYAAVGESPHAVISIDKYIQEEESS